MPSENKTPNLGLNKWMGNEYPKRSDFVDDNEKIDTAVKKAEDDISKLYDVSLVHNTQIQENTMKLSEKANQVEVSDLSKKVNSNSEQLAEITNQQGDLTQLPTTDKSNLVNAMKEVFTNVGNGKNSLYSAIIGKNQTPTSKDFSALVTAINNITLGSGNATTADVLSGKTFTNDGGVQLTGTMPNRSSGGYTTDSITHSGTELRFSIPDSGYYGDSAYIRASDGDFIASNIRSGKNIFGVNGSLVEGKKWASGTVLSSERLFPLNDIFDNEVQFCPVSVSGLSFKPKIVLLYNNFSGEYSIYNAMKFYYTHSTTIGAEINMDDGSLCSISAHSWLNICDGSFTLPIRPWFYETRPLTVEWIAYE